MHDDTAPPRAHDGKRNASARYKRGRSRFAFGLCALVLIGPAHADPNASPLSAQIPTMVSVPVSTSGSTSGRRRASVPAPATAQALVPAQASATVMDRMEVAINSNASVLRYMLNECVIASVASVVIMLSLSGPVSPAVAAATGATPGLSLPGVGALGCGAGAVGGAAAAAVIYAWEEPAAVVETVTTPVALAWNALTTREEWSLLALMTGGGEAIRAAIAGSGSDLLAWASGGTKPAPVYRADVLPSRMPYGVVQAAYQPGTDTIGRASRRQGGGSAVAH